MNFEKESVLTLTECKEIVRNYLLLDEFKVSDYKVEPFLKDANRLLITVNFVTKNGAETKTFVAKRFPHNREIQNEIFTYQVLFKEFERCSSFTSDFTPAVYYNNDNLLVFENLAEKQFITHVSSKHLPLDHVEICLQLLAKFHAGSIAYQELKSKELQRKYRLIDNYEKYIQKPRLRKDESFQGYQAFKAKLNKFSALVDLISFSDVTPEVFKQKLEELTEKAFEIAKPKEDFYNVLCHGDLWANKFLFRYQNGAVIDAKMIDFQLQRYCPPACDVLQFLFLTLTSSARQKHLHALLRYYYNCLSEELRKSMFEIDQIIPYNHFEISVNYVLPLIKLLMAYYSSEIHKNTSLIELFNTDAHCKNFLVDIVNDLKHLVTHDIISVEDCYSIIERNLGTTDYILVDYSVNRITNLSGFLGDHYRLKIDLSERSLNLFAKCAPKNRTRFDLAIGAKVFLKESFMLETLLPMIKNSGVDDIQECVVPHYLLRVNDVIVFDDLTFRGFRPATQRVPFTIDELKVVVRKLAIYHASNIVLEEKSGKRLSAFKNELEESFFPLENHNHSSLSIKLAVETVPFQAKLFSDLQFPEDFDDRIQKAYEVCYQLVKPSSVYRNVVCHGDLWADNIMLKYDDEKPVDCRIIDYQILRYCPPAHDLLTLLYLTTTRAIRLIHLNTLIDFYYSTFCHVLNRHDCDVADIYTYDQFLASCHIFTPQAVCQTVLFYHFTMTSPALMKDYIKDEIATRKIFLEDRRDFIRDMCDKDPVYKARMRESLEDLKEMCLKYF